jgi:hypothetical protein
MDLEVKISSEDDAGMAFERDYYVNGTDKVLALVRKFESERNKTFNQTAKRRARRYREAILSLDGENCVRDISYCHREPVVMLVGDVLRLKTFDDIDEDIIGGFIDEGGKVVVTVQHDEMFASIRLDGEDVEVPLMDDVFADNLLDNLGLNWFRKHCLFIVNDNIVLRNVQKIGGPYTEEYVEEE